MVIRYRMDESREASITEKRKQRSVKSKVCFSNEANENKYKLEDEKTNIQNILGGEENARASRTYNELK